MTPLISIVIPTRNRQQYCIAAIENILSYDYSRFELCVQDNSDDDQIEQYINNRETDTRLVYRRIPEQIASIFNIGDSLGLATGKYVILIGDDDTILPSLFTAAEYMNANDIDSLCPIPIINYYWPGAHPIYSEGYLTIPPQIYEYNVMENVDQKLEVLFNKGIVRYLSYHLPKVYHGIVRRDILEKIKNKTGHYAGGLSPDIFLSVAISSLVKNHHTSNFSVSIAGACSKSTTSQNLNNGHRGELRDAPHFKLRGKYLWDQRVPDYYSVDTIWAESALKAVEEMNLLKLNECFNFNYLAAYSLLNNRSIFWFAFNHTFNKWKGITYIQKIALVTLNAISIYTSYIYLKIKRIFDKPKEIVQIESISDISGSVKAVESSCKLTVN